MDPVPRAVSIFLREQGIGRGCPLLTAVSGGADSIALLHVLAALGQRVGVAHVHHGLRGDEADTDLEFVRGIACRLGVRFHERRVDASVRDGRSPEARARELRYAALEEIRSGGGYASIATAHTLDDQAETVLLRAARGASPPGLSGIGAADPETRVVRPMLRVRREAVRRYLRQRRLEWREDSSNADVRIPRNRVRHQVLEALEKSQPGAIPALARLADASRELGLWLRAEAGRAIAGFELREGSTTALDRSRLLELPPPLRAQAIVEMLDVVGLRERVTRELVDRVLTDLLGERPRGRVSLPAGWSFVRDADRVWLEEEVPSTRRSWERVLVPPLPLDVPERSVRFEWISAPEGVGVSRPNSVLLPRHVAEDLRVRAVAPRDRMTLAGESRSRPLRELFRVARWPSRARRDALVVTWCGEIVWVVGLAGAGFPGASGDGWELRAVRVSAQGPAC